MNLMIFLTILILIAASYNYINALFVLTIVVTIQYFYANCIEPDKFGLIDDLTGLLNRKGFRLTINRRRKIKKKGALLFVDLDKFKKINDNCGHNAGDLVLMNVATAIKDILREDDIVCRFGGDEFIIYLNGCDNEHSILISEKIRLAIEKINYKNNDTLEVFKISASIGFVYIENSSPKKIISKMTNADKACYLAKNSGSNKVCG